ncbi:MAG: DoxX family membrane protein [Acidobacteria bacterium]|nr:DoxX family membrane protein [Acidobacteriota bacterium]
MFLASHLKQTTYLGYLVLPRLAVGYFFLHGGWAKFRPGFLSGEGLIRQLAEPVLQDPILWHRDFIQGTVIPNAHVFSYLVCFGEIAIGVSLLVGCLVRLSSVFGAFHNLNILLAIAVGGGPTQLGLNLICIPLHIIFVFASAGRVLGIDGILKSKFPLCRLF